MTTTKSSSSKPAPIVVCPCVKRHSPTPSRYEKHHIHPQAWGGTNAKENMIWLCSNAHDSVHHLLEHYVRHQAEPPPAILRRFSAFVRNLAKEAIAREGGIPPLKKGSGKVPAALPSGSS